MRRSSRDSTRFDLAKPATTRSMASSKSDTLTAGCLLRAAMSAASLHTLARSAPLMPGVSDATFSATAALSASRSSLLMLPALPSSGASLIGFMCTIKMSRRPLMSGKSTVILRSNRPGRSSALSSTSGRLVPASITIPALESKPSSSTSSWFNVLSRSEFDCACAVRARPMASISSMNTIDGAALRASANSARTRAGPTPTNISWKSEPATLKNGTPASPAVALASSVLPVPGGPTSSAPFGMRAPRRLNFFGRRKNSTNSITSVLASSRPATSLNFLPLRLPPAPKFFGGANMLMMPPLRPPAARLDSTDSVPISSTNGTNGHTMDMNDGFFCL
mmetsp:Transcript_43717/g.107307  ORF Transcript_43717/g.107307 Transcript_43717/m.107307 type:complete len:336 (-) Transcript_43717:452-1459(-)